MPNWQVQTARLTVFVTPDFVAPPTLWRDCVGDEPETSVLKRATATKTEIGAFAEAKLTMQIQPIRIDWVHEAAGIAGELGLPPVLGPFPAAADPLLQLSRRWATSDSFPGTPRIALGLALISSTTDRASGYRELAGFVDGVPAEPNATDFQYQVNLPRDSRAGVNGLRVNRLSKWSVALWRVFVVTPAAPSGNQIVSPGQYHLRLELDVNTHSDFEGLLPRDKGQMIINDLFDGAQEVCAQGTR